MSPDEARNTDDDLRLYSDDASYDVTLSIAEHFTDSGDCVDVMFASVDPTLTYSIDYVSGSGDSTTLMTSTAYSDLNDDALPEADPPQSFDDPGADGDELADREAPPIQREDLAPEVVAALDAPTPPDAYG